MNIRLEQPQDFRAVEELTREAFWNVYRPGCTEHFVLNRYRSNPDFMPGLDFVMEDEGRIIGHVMYSKASIVLADGTSFLAWTFGPISIHPDCQRRGLGLRLLRHSMAKAREMGVGLLCMEGNIDFYRHAGFSLASGMKIHYHAEPADAEVPYFLAQELIAGYWQGREGTYRPPQGYLAADDDPEAFAAFEATFAAKKKALLPGQLPQLCQSCGMRLASDDDCGKEADGSVNYDYCHYCYADGQFAQQFTLDGMIDHCSRFIEEMNKMMPRPMTADQYRQMARQLFPNLKRWRKAKR